MLYRSDGYVANTPPQAPTGLISVVEGNQVALHWDAASDAETPAAALSYNVRIGTTPGGGDVWSPAADPMTGERWILAAGNAGQNLEATAVLPGPGTYYWSVQAIDASYAGSVFAAEQTFGVVGYVDIGAGLPAFGWAETAWGDWDGDGDLDLIFIGKVDNVATTELYRNDDGIFTLVVDGGGRSALPGVSLGAVAWGDCDGDGDLDVLIAGLVGLQWDERITRLYRNDGDGSFTDLEAGLPGTSSSVAAWGDYDNDGDLDLYVSGYNLGYDKVGGIYRNDGGGVFTPLATDIHLFTSGSAAWGDYDADGDLDLLLTGSSTYSGNDLKLYRNDGEGTFVEVATGIPGIYEGGAAWGDHDGDGDLDILVGGEMPDESMSHIYDNDGAGGFVDLGLDLPALMFGSVAWGDWDDDGDPDALMSGYFTDLGYATIIARNDGGGDFSVVNPGVDAAGCAVFGDYDRDGDLDLTVIDITAPDTPTRIYSCFGAPTNTPPEAPTNLQAQQSDGVLTLSWDAATDDHTSSSRLSYNLRVGVTPGRRDHARDGGPARRRPTHRGSRQRPDTNVLGDPDAGDEEPTVHRCAGDRRFLRGIDVRRVDDRHRDGGGAGGDAGRLCAAGQHPESLQPDDRPDVRPTGVTARGAGRPRRPRATCWRTARRGPRRRV